MNAYLDLLFAVIFTTLVVLLLAGVVALIVWLYREITKGRSK